MRRRWANFGLVELEVLMDIQGVIKYEIVKGSGALSLEITVNCSEGIKLVIKTLGLSARV